MEIKRNPLTAEQIAILRQEQQNLVIIRDAIEMAKRAGLDVSADEERFREAEKRLKQLLEVYG